MKRSSIWQMWLFKWMRPKPKRYREFLPPLLRLEAYALAGGEDFDRTRDMAVLLVHGWLFPFSPKNSPLVDHVRNLIGDQLADDYTEENFRPELYLAQYISAVLLKRTMDEVRNSSSEAYFRYGKEFGSNIWGLVNGRPKLAEIALGIIENPSTGFDSDETAREVRGQVAMYFATRPAEWEDPRGADAMPVLRITHDQLADSLGFWARWGQDSGGEEPPSVVAHVPTVSSIYHEIFNIIGPPPTGAGRDWILPLRPGTGGRI